MTRDRLAPPPIDTAEIDLCGALYDLGEPGGLTLSRRKATITAVGTSTVTINLGGTVIAGVQVFGTAYSPLAGDVVYVDVLGGDPIVVGPLGWVPLPQIRQHSLDNGTATTNTEWVTVNAAAVAAVATTMIVRVYGRQGFSGAINSSWHRVHDEGGTNITLDTGGEYAINNGDTGRWHAAAFAGKKQYAAGATMGYRLAYRVDVSNLYADYTTEVLFVRGAI